MTRRSIDREPAHNPGDHVCQPIDGVCKHGRGATPAPYPEHEKLKRVADRSQAIGEFVDWLHTQGVTLAHWHNCTQLVPHGTPIEKLLARYFEIDLDKIEEEKRAMLAALRGADDAR